MLVDFNSISDDSRVWIYASEQKLSINLEKYITNVISSMLHNWEAHNNPLTASVTILHNYFIIIALDERYVSATGCSIDKILDLIKTLEIDLSLSLLNRLNIYCLINNKIKCLTIEELPIYATSKSLFYDLTINKKKELINWLKPIENSWCDKYLK